MLAYLLPTMPTPSANVPDPDELFNLLGDISSETSPTNPPESKKNPFSIDDLFSSPVPTKSAASRPSSVTSSPSTSSSEEDTFSRLQDILVRPELAHQNQAIADLHTRLTNLEQRPQKDSPNLSVQSSEISFLMDQKINSLLQQLVQKQELQQTQLLQSFQQVSTRSLESLLPLLQQAIAQQGQQLEMIYDQKLQALQAQSDQKITKILSTLIEILQKNQQQLEVSQDQRLQTLQSQSDQKITEILSTLIGILQQNKPSETVSLSEDFSKQMDAIKAIFSEWTQQINSNIQSLETRQMTFQNAQFEQVNKTIGDLEQQLIQTNANIPQILESLEQIVPQIMTDMQIYYQQQFSEIQDQNQTMIAEMLTDTVRALGQHFSRKLAQAKQEIKEEILLEIQPFLKP